MTDRGLKWVLYTGNSFKTKNDIEKCIIVIDSLRNAGRSEYFPYGLTANENMMTSDKNAEARITKRQVRTQPCVA